MTEPPFYPETQLAIFRKYLSKLKSQELMDALAEEFHLIPKKLDPLEWMVRHDLARTVGTVCSHGLGGGRCPFENNSLHIQAPAYAKVDAPETSDYPVPLDRPENSSLNSLMSFVEGEERELGEQGEAPETH